MDSLMDDDIIIETPTGERTGPVKASVQGNKIYVNDESLVIEEGGKIFRPLPNGKSECHLILQVDFHNDPQGRLSHYEITTRKESSLVQTPTTTTINISNSRGIQIGDHNVQNIIASLETLVKAIESADSTDEEKATVKQKLKDVLSHPLTTSVLGSAAGRIISML